MPKISIIVPVYNTEQYLRKCLNSLINQTLSDIEIIVVNDGSFDNSANIINEFYNKYPHKFIFLYKDNGGLSDARNVGIEHATGEYISFVNSNDFLEETMYEELYNEAKKDNFDFVECNFDFFPSKEKNIVDFSYSTIDDYFLFGRVVAWNKIYKTSIIKNNNISFPINLKYADIEFFYKLVPFVKTSSVINSVLYHSCNKDSSDLLTEKEGDIYIILNNLLSYYKSNHLYDKYFSNLEYLFTKILLKDSFNNIVRIKDRTVRQKLINKSYNELCSTFPNWKNNILLSNSVKNKFYYLITNKFIYKLRAFIYTIFNI